MIHLDGSTGEGGGQILRTALGLSLVTGQPFSITNIRASRKKPGLMRQHLTAVRAAAEIGDADLSGDAIGSSTLSFIPKALRGGNYSFSIGTAGSCTLVFQAILPGLLMADKPTELVIEGGTHNPHAPPFDFLTRTFLPLIARMGAKVDAQLVRPGFFPAGGGKVAFSISPTSTLKPIELLDLPETTTTAQAVSSKLPEHIGRRELQTIQSKLHLNDNQLENLQLDSYGPGNVVSIFVESKMLTETFTGFGEKNVSAEKVAMRVARQAGHYLETGAPVGPYLADQLLIPMALAGSGCFRTGSPSNHTLTNISTIQNFIDVHFDVSEKADKSYEIRVFK